LGGGSLVAPIKFSKEYFEEKKRKGGERKKGKGRGGGEKKHTLNFFSLGSSLT